MSFAETPTLPFAPQVDSIESWLSDLPVTKTRECCRILYEGLQALNACEVDPQLRFQALEKFRPLVFVQARNLIPYFMDRPLPLADKIRKVAKLSAQFHAELARGYQTITYHQDFPAVFELAVQATIVHRALHSYQLFLLRLAQMYEMPHASVWKKVNGLYLLAERADLHGWVPSEADRVAGSRLSIEDIFKCIVVFRLIAPNRLSQAEIDRAHDLLTQFCTLVCLRQKPIGLGAQPAFCIDLAASQVPRLSAPLAAGEENVRYLFLDVFTGNLARLRQPTVPASSRLNERLSFYLQARLGEIPPLLAEQKHRNAVLILGYDRIVSGLGAILFKAEDQVSWAGTRDLELVPLSDHLGLNAGPESSKSAGTFSSAGSIRKAIKTTEEEDIWGQPKAEFPCQVYRTEAPGLYLLEHGGGALRAGALVGLNTDNKLIQVGLICGGQCETAPSLVAFELLASDVMLASVYTDAAPQIGHKALLFKMGLTGTNGEDCYGLIVQPLMLRSGEGLTVDSGGNRDHYRVAKLLETTSEFSQFEIVRHESAASA